MPHIKTVCLLKMFRKDYTSTLTIILVQITFTTFLGDILDDVS